MQIEFSIRNATSETISYETVYNGTGFTGVVLINPNEDRFTSGGGILDGDSVIFVKVSTSDSLVYRNARHGDDINSTNHLYNFDNWVEEKNNKFFYSVREEDFQ